MICDLEKQKPMLIGSNFDIRQVQDRAEIKNIISVINQISLLMSIWLFTHSTSNLLLFCYLGTVSLTFLDMKMENQSLSSLFCDQEIASIFDVIVLPEMRGKGLVKAMTLKAVLRAQRL